MEDLERQKAELLSSGLDGEAAAKQMAEEREKFNQQMMLKE